MADKNLHVTIITPARAVFDSDAKAVVAPAFDGEVGVLPDHAPMLALLGTGELRVTTVNGNTDRLAIRGGFLQVNKNHVTVLTPEAVAGSEVKADALQNEIQKLDAEKVTKLEERESQQTKRDWIKARQKVSGAKAHSAGH
jgi:F-type H+-transporting ATPase subunit epsilon